MPLEDMLIKDLFASDVTRDIPPVVYFHEQSPTKLADEVSEYIITGGWPDGHPHQKRVPNGIHEQYVHLLRAIVTELDKSGGPELPTAWISGFYGSGKSSFAKLLGLALDGVELPGGRSLADAWLERDTSPRHMELKKAWAALRAKVDPIAVVFDVGSVARDNEQIHAAALRQLQRRLGYSTADPLVADFELSLERRGEWARFEKVAEETLKQPWAEVKDKALAEDDFSLVMSVMFPEHYPDPTAWYTARGGTHSRSESPEEAVKAIGDMLAHRNKDASLFFVVDEVSQYVLANKDRVDRLRAFATALGARLKGKAWLLALGQQKIDEEAGDSFLLWAKDRFPPKLRVHLEATNIRDVVHKRLLQKKPEHEKSLAALFERHRSTLELYAYGCRDVSPEEFAEVYPMLPGQIDLLLQITSALRTRSARSQGDDQAIRGLLQLLGELFRGQKLADKEVGHLVTLDQIYEVQHTALDSDVQASMARVLAYCAELPSAQDPTALTLRSAKAVALLELLQELGQPTTPELVAQCLYDHVDRGNQVTEVREALEDLRRHNLLGYSEKDGYKIQSSAGEEWDRERRDMPAPTESRSEVVRESLKYLLALPEKPRYQGRPFPWAGLYSDGRRAEDVPIEASRDPAAIRVDLRFLTSREARAESDWVKRSDETALRERLIWIVGETDRLEDLAREYVKSRAMVRKYEPRKESLLPTKKLLLQQEQNNEEDLAGRLHAAVEEAFMGGTMYFAGRPLAPRDFGSAFATAIHGAATRILPDLFPHFDATQVLPGELNVLLEKELSAPSPKFLPEALGILELDSGRYVPSCSGTVPVRVFEKVKAEDGLGGGLLLSQFGAPPYGYTDNVVKACVAGLLRAGRIRIQPEGLAEITAIRDAGVREVFEKERAFKRATIVPAGDDDIGVTARNRICRFFEDRLEVTLDREDHIIADAVSHHFPLQAARLRSVLARLATLPDRPEPPEALVKLEDALEKCVAICRQTKQTVARVKKFLNVLNDGFKKLNLFASELTEPAIEAVRAAAAVRDHHAAQLAEVDALAADAEAAVGRISEHLKRERPWDDIAALDPDLERLRAAYREERARLLAWQEQETEQRKARLKLRPGYSTLSGKQTNAVLRPFALAESNTSADAVHPPLASLKDPFLMALRRAEEEANDLLDGVLSEGDEIVERLDLGLHNREVATEADVKALVSEVEERLLAKVKRGVRVRIK